MDLSIVIPAYNEAVRLPDTLARIKAYLATKPWSTEIIVVDDGSDDETANLVRAFEPSIRLIQHPHNMGKGAAVRTGMLATQGHWALLTDADLSTPIEELDHFWSTRDQAEILIGSRRIKGAQVDQAQAKWKVLLGQLGNLMIQVTLVPGLKDTQCGFKLFTHRTRRLFELQQLNRFGYDFELLFLARRLHFRVLELPVRWVNNPLTKVKPIDYLTTLLDIARIRWHAWRGHYPKHIS